MQYAPIRRKAKKSQQQSTISKEIKPIPKKKATTSRLTTTSPKSILPTMSVCWFQEDVLQNILDLTKMLLLLFKLSTIQRSQLLQYATDYRFWLLLILLREKCVLDIMLVDQKSNSQALLTRKLVLIRLLLMEILWQLQHGQHIHSSWLSLLSYWEPKLPFDWGVF